MRSLTIVLLMLLPGSAAASTYYKCVTEKGRTVYSATPCGANAEKKQFKDDLEPSAGKLQLVMDRSNSYHVDGTVNHLPVTFVVDTGATNTAISQRVADAAGLGPCVGTGQVATANGVAQICIVIVPEIIFGGFHVRYLRVGVMPNLPVDALLGMDVLGRLKIQQENNVLYISGN